MKVQTVSMSVGQNGKLKIIDGFNRRHFMCDFCKKFDFGIASCVVDQYGASIVMAGGSYRFPEHQQFLFCPKCGASRLKKNILPPMEERKFPPHNQPQPFILN